MWNFSPNCWCHTWVRNILKSSDIWLTSHIQGKQLITADALSWIPASKKDGSLKDEVLVHVSFVVNSLLAIEEQLREIRMKHRSSFHDRSSHIESQLFVVIQQLVQSSRIVIPAVMWFEILDSLHSGRQGINKCRLRTQAFSGQAHLTELVSNCMSHQECNQTYYSPTSVIHTLEFYSLPM